MVLGGSTPGELERNSILEKIDLDNKQIIYRVNYLCTGLSSTAYLNLSDKSIQKEVFAGKWVVTYEYDSAIARHSHVPSGFTIYKDAGNGNPGQVISTYAMAEMIPGKGAKYKNQSGNIKEVDFIYFDIMPTEY